MNIKSDLIDRDETINEIHKLAEQSSCRATELRCKNGRGKGMKAGTHNRKYEYIPPEQRIGKKEQQRRKRRELNKRMH